MDVDKVKGAVGAWVESMVIGRNLCPFAKREWVSDRVRLVVSEARTEEELLLALQGELLRLGEDPSIETTLLIHPQVLARFDDYNQFLDLADGLLQAMELEGIFQVASFHPVYQFAGTEPEDAENYTNRSPYPLLHILREESLERVIASYPDVAEIPVRNIALLESVGAEALSSEFEGFSSAQPFGVRD